MEYRLKLRIVAVKPPIGFWFWLEDKEGNTFSATESKGEDIAFDFDVIVKENAKTGSPNFTGQFVSGTPSERFFYINNGKVPDKMEGRTKIWITGKYIQPPIDWETIKEASSSPDKMLMARYMATGKDGRPACASVKLEDGWVIASEK